MEILVVSKKKKKNLSEDDVRFRAETAWIARVDAVAKRLGLTRSAYIRLVVSRELERVEARDRKEEEE